MVKREAKQGTGGGAEKGGQDRQCALLCSHTSRQAGHVLAPELILIRGKLR